MEINKSDRNQLKSYFVRNAIPTEQHFAEFIDGTFNQKEDGIVKPAGSPLSLEAVGDASSERNALAFYESFGDASPAWQLSLNPRSVVSDPASARAGLSIADGGGGSRLFIDRGTGNVGVGTISPESALHVAGAVRADSGLVVPAGQPVTGIPIVDLRTCDFSHSRAVGYLTLNKLITFDQPVVSAASALSKFDVYFMAPSLSGGGEQHYIHRVKVESSCTVDGNTVDVEMKAELQDSSKNEHFDAHVTVLVFAILQNTI